MSVSIHTAPIHTAPIHTAPIRTAAAALVAGAAFSRIAAPDPALLVTAATLVASVAWALLRRRTPRTAWQAALACIAAATAVAGSLAPGIPALALPEVEVAAVTGIVTEGPDVLRGDGPHAPTRELGLRLDLGGCTARVIVETPADAPLPDILPGDHVRATGRVRPRPPPGNPGQSLAPSESVLDVRASHIARTARGQGPLNAFLRCAERARRAVDARLAAACGAGSQAHAVFRCLLTGDRSAVDPDVARAFRESGTAHLLAVSGLHLVLLVGGLAAVARRVVPRRARRRFGLPCLLLTVIAYAAICRFQTPVVRAAVFVVVGAIGRAAGRRTTTLDHLALASAIVLTADPGQIADIGFQLSFAAVAGIALLSRGIRGAGFPHLALLEKFPEAMSRTRLRLLQAFAGGLATTAAAQAATAPVVAATFGTSQPAGLGANLIAVPVFAFVLPFAAVLAVIGGAVPVVTAPLSNWVARVFVGIADLASATPFGHVALGRPPPVLLAASLALRVLAARVRSWRRRDLWLPVLAWAAAGLGPLALPGESRAVAVVLDAGHGLAVLVRSPSGGAFLYDAGGRANGIGDRVILPALRALGVRRLDALVLSHEDSDHCGAAADVLRGLPVGRVVVPSGFGASPLAAAVLAACRNAGVGVEGALAGDLLVAPGLRAFALHPRTPALQGAENEDSLVLHVTADDPSGRPLTLLLTGDIDGRPLDELPAQPGALPVRVFVLPHHGLGASGPQVALADSTHAEILVASNGDAETVTVAGAWVTGECGAVRVRAGQPPEAWPW